MKLQSRNQALVWGSLLIIFGVVGLVESFIDLTPWAWVAILAATGLGIFGLYLRDRSEGWPLIPAYALWAVAGLLALVELNVLRDDFLAAYVLFTIALPFIAVYLRDRSQWWALIPAYVLLSIGIMIPLEEIGFLNDFLVPAYVMFVIALPFFVVYIRNPKQWWPLIPGGIMAAIGLSFLLVEAFQYVFPALVILVGLWVLIRSFTRKEPLNDEPSLPAEVDDGDLQSDE